MSSNIAIKVDGITKRFEIYEQPRDRLKQFILPILQRRAGKPAKAYYQPFWALRGVNFEVFKGETVGIIGRNGSGKSTLLQIICGTLSPTSGAVEANGRIAALLELGSGFNPDFTGRENVYLNGSVLGLTKAEIDARFDEIASFAEIGQFIEQPVKTYSSGMIVRLAFAVAINAEPQILVVDEALSVGDELFQRKCFSRIEAIRESGATILFVSHSGGTIVELCDRAILLDSGECLAVGTPKKMVARYQKLLYAPEERREQIRKEIRADSEEFSQHPAESQAKSVEPETLTLQVEPEPDGIPDTFDPGLQPTSTIAYESHGALIADCAIYSSTGERVNNLTRGKTYSYRYRVAFTKHTSNVRFGMMVKTTNGVELGGAASASSARSSVSHVPAKSEYVVEFRFECRLNPGVYFLNAGVVGDLNGNETYLHRLIDAAMFRVLSEVDNVATGIVDFACSSQLTEIEP